MDGPPAKNQLTGYAYDAAGNLLSDGLGHNFTYDAANRLTTVSSGGSYTYDGDGERVRKSTGTLYWSGIAESDGSGNITAEYMFFNGMRVARVDRPSLKVHYFLGDHLGSTRMQVTPIAGQSTVTVEEDLDYTPYGITAGATATDHYQFTGKEFDSESSLDYFGARYYGSSVGRFTTSDPLVMSSDRLIDPQALNLYAYVRNSPLMLTDLTGMKTNTNATDPPPDCSPGADSCRYAGAEKKKHGVEADQRERAQNQHWWLWNVGHALGVVSTPQEKAFRAAIEQDMKAHPEKYPVSIGAVTPFGGVGSAAARAGELANAMGKTKDFVTIAVTETEQGVNVVSSSENALRPAVKAMLGEGEVAAQGAGHAEVTGVNAAQQMGLTPTGVAASRGICPSCAQFLQDLGVAALSLFK